MDMEDERIDSSEEGTTDVGRKIKKNPGGGGGIGRACDFCHRMKMKCIGKENPPCNRCRDSGHECTFDVPRKAKAIKLEDRVRQVEGQMDNMQASLAELLRLQRAQMASQGDSRMLRHNITGPSAPSHRSPSTYNSPGNMLSIDNILADSGRPPTSSNAFGINITSHPEQPYTPTSLPLVTPDTAQGMFNNRPGLPPTTSSTSNTTPWTGPLQPVSRSRNSPAPSDDDDENDPNDPLKPAVILAPWDNMFSLAEAARLKADDKSPQDEVDEEEDESIRSESRGRKRRKTGDLPNLVDRTSCAGSVHNLPGNDNASGADRFDAVRLENKNSNSASRVKREDNDGVSPRAGLLKKGTHTQAFLDPVELGYCTEEKGRQLYDLFFEGCSIYMPIFEPGVDTWESLRQRSPFAITTIIMVGAKVEDGSQPPSDLQSKCREHAEKIGMSTLFTPVARIEDLQAMILLTAWGDTSWRPGGHALRMAMDMGLFRCLSSIFQLGSPVGKSEAQLLEERPLIVGARIWLAIYKQEHEMSFNLGRPALTMGQETITHARVMLEHPHSIRTDSRLVATCEMLSLRVTMHQPFSVWPSAIFPGLDERIREANEEFDVWQKYWEGYYERLGIPPGHFLRESLLTQKSHSILQTNARILTGIRSKRDVALLSEERRNALLKAITAASKVVSMAVRSQDYTKNFRYANHYTHVSMAFAARFLIRLATLLPHAVNLRQTGRDVEQVAKMLSEVPGFQYAYLLRDAIGKARRKRVLPPASKAASPTKWPHPLPNTTVSPPLQDRQGNPQNPRQGNEDNRWNNLLTTNWTPVNGSGNTNPNGNISPSSSPLNFSSLNNPANASGGGMGEPDFSHMDFMLVDQLFNSGSNGQPGGLGGLGTALMGGLGGDFGGSINGFGSVGFGGNGAPGPGGVVTNVTGYGMAQAVGALGVVGDGPSGGGLQDFGNFTAASPMDRNFVDSVYTNLDAWFPFPPLEDLNGYQQSGNFR